MILSSKVTWGLAWTGLALVLAVPSADYLTGKFGGDSKAAVITSTTDAVKPVKTATVTTTKTPNGIKITPAGSKPAKAGTSTDPVDKFVENGKKLPDYISDNGSAPAATTTTETQVASISPAPIVAPTPFPAWARPKATPGPIATPKPDPVVIVDEETMTGSIDTPAASPTPPALVDDTDNWDNETLRQYLERRGILEGSGNQSSATVTERSTNYDPDGFYLNDGPNNGNGRETRRERIRRLFLENNSDDVEF